MGSDNLLTVPHFIRRGGVWWSNMQSCLTTRSCFSCPIMFSYDTMKASHGGNDELSDSTTHKRGCHGIVLLSVMTGWHSWTSSQLLQLLLLWPPASKLSIAIHHLPHMASYGGYCFWVGETDSGLCANFKLSVFCFFFPRIAITSYFNNGVKLMKGKKGDKCVTQSLPPSLELPL